METKRSIVWFKSDLRISDNEALVKAVKESEEIKTNKPQLNRALRRSIFTHGLFSFVDELG